MGCVCVSPQQLQLVPAGQLQPWPWTGCALEPVLMAKTPGLTLPPRPHTWPQLPSHPEAGYKGVVEANSAGREEAQRKAPLEDGSVAS